MPMYSDPASYYGRKQQQSSQTLMSMLNTMMRIKMMKKEQERWEQGHELDTMRAETYKQSVEQAGMPKPLEKTRLAQLLMQFDPETPQGVAIRKANKIKTPEDERRAKEVFEERETFKAELGQKYAVPPKQTAYDKKLAAAKIALKNKVISQETYNKIDMGLSEEPKLSMGSRLSNRTRIADDVEDTFVKLKNDPNAKKIFSDPKTIAEYKATLGIHLDMPAKYTKIMKWIEQDIADPDEMEWFKYATGLKEFLDQNPKIISIAQLPPTLRAISDPGVVAYILRFRTIKRTGPRGIDWLKKDIQVQDIK